MTPTQRTDSKDILPNAWKIVTDAEFPFAPEVRFHPTRKWRFDWACHALMIAVEVEGVTHFGRGIGRHQGAKGIEADMEKYNAAVELGWRVLRYSQRMIKSEPHEVVDQIIRVARAMVEREIE